MTAAMHASHTPQKTAQSHPKSQHRSGAGTCSVAIRPEPPPSPTNKIRDPFNRLRSTRHTKNKPVQRISTRETGKSRLHNRGTAGSQKRSLRTTHVPGAHGEREHNGRQLARGRE